MPKLFIALFSLVILSSQVQRGGGRGCDPRPPVKQEELCCRERTRSTTIFRAAAKCPRVPCGRTPTLSVSQVREVVSDEDDVTVRPNHSKSARSSTACHLSSPTRERESQGERTPRRCRRAKIPTEPYTARTREHSEAGLALRGSVMILDNEDSSDDALGDDWGYSRRSRRRRRG